jgi:hypothetical protein
MVIQIGVHPTRKQPDQHIVHVTPGVSHTITIHEVPTKSKLGPCTWDDVMAPSHTQPSRHPRLPHSPYNKPPQSRVA